jgi:hypothetical protein
VGGTLPRCDRRLGRQQLGLWRFGGRRLLGGKLGDLGFRKVWIHPEKRFEGRDWAQGTAISVQAIQALSFDIVAVLEGSRSRVVERIIGVMAERGVGVGIETVHLPPFKSQAPRVYSYQLARIAMALSFSYEDERKNDAGSALNNRA